MHAHVRYSRVLHYRQGSKLRGRTYTLVHVTYLDVLYPVPVRTRSYRNVRTRVRSVRAHVRSHRFERRTKPNAVETGRTPGSRLSRSSPDATSSQYRVSPLAELVSDLCQSRASRHSPFLPAGYSISYSTYFRSAHVEIRNGDFTWFPRTCRLESRGRIPFTWLETNTYTLGIYVRVAEELDTCIYRYTYVQ